VKYETRNYLIDNLKAIAILGVIVGHLLGFVNFQNYPVSGMHRFLNLLHVPLLALLSGLTFSKNNVLKNIRLLLVLLIWHNILVLVYRFTGSGVKFGLPMYPLYGTWYLLSLVSWNIMAEHINKLKMPILISLILSIIVTLTPKVSGIISLSRTISFFPFFLIGSNFKEIVKFNERSSKVVKVFCLICTVLIYLVVCLYIKANGYPDLKMIQHSISYASFMKVSPMKMIALKLGIYLISISLCLFLIIITSSKKSFLSEVGQYSLYPYLIHLAFPRLIKHMDVYSPKWIKTLSTSESVVGIIILFILAYTFSYLVTRKQFRRTLDFLFNPKLELILKDKTLIEKGKKV